MIENFPIATSTVRVRLIILVIKINCSFFFNQTSAFYTICLSIFLPTNYLLSRSVHKYEFMEVSTTIIKTLTNFEIVLF